jgi:NitT/TauT family transport system permease protein
LIGFVIAVVLSQSQLLERGLVPWVVASQTVPILAIAPMVVVGLGSKGVAGWKAVAILAAYLTFFPVAINTLRGLHSVDPRAVQLMESYAASRWRVLWQLRVPASVPYIFTALKISATASVIGAIIGESPASIQDGLGGAIVNFNQYYSLQPTYLWATNVICAALGIAFFLAVVAAERLVLRGAPENVA